MDRRACENLGRLADEWVNGWLGGWVFGLVAINGWVTECIVGWLGEWMRLGKHNVCVHVAVRMER